MNLWMRWVNFQVLREILLLVKSNPAKLRAADLVRLTTEERILVGRNGQPLGPTSHYHHRRTLERLGLLVKRAGRYTLNEQLPEVGALTEQSSFGKELDDREKKAFSNVVLRNEDCRDVFFERFLQPMTSVQNVMDFTARAQPIELSVVQKQDSPHHHGRRTTTPISDAYDQLTHVAIRPAGEPEWSMIFGTNAMQAIHFGLRAWCVDQLNFLDSIYRTGAIYTIYPRHITSRLSTGELELRMLELLTFEGDWATVRVGDFALDVGIKQQESIEQGKGVLRSWIENYPDLVATIPTNERFIAGGLPKGQRDLVLKGFLLGRDGAHVSHLRIHRNIQHRINRKVLP